MVVEITSTTFNEEVINSEIPVLVDFWAAWCGPCKMVAPVIEELSDEYEGRMKICKLDVDEVSDVAAQFSVMSIPTLILFNKGEVVVRTTGALSKENLISFVEPHLRI